MTSPSRAPFCWQLNEHEYRATPNSTGFYCIHCGAGKSFVAPVPQTKRSEPRKAATKKPAEPTTGDPHRKPWAHARLYGVTECFYCRLAFAEVRPPTFDHIVPLCEGGNKGHGVVLACALCNSARGFAPFMEYVTAVCAEHAAARKQRRSYRRPKMRYTPDGWAITTATRREWRGR